MSAFKRRVETDPRTGCWNWTGGVRRPERPYGSLVIGSRSDGTRRRVSAHRLAYEIWVGPITDDLCVCHRCDNPRCVNPDHLFLGTKKDNADDRDAKGRGAAPPHPSGERHARATLTDAQVDEIRESDLSSRKIAALYGVTDGHVRAIRRGDCRPQPPKIDAALQDRV